MGNQFQTLVSRPPQIGTMDRRVLKSPTTLHKNTESDTITEVDHPINNYKKLYTVETWAGDGSINSRNGKGKDCGINWPYEIKFSSDGNGIFSAYGSASVCSITPDGTVTKLCDSTPDGLKFHCVRGLALDKKGSIYITDTGNNAIRRITKDGTCETILPQAEIYSPYGITVSDDGTIYISDTYADCITSISPNGSTHIIAGSVSGFKDGVGTEAHFCQPQGLELDNEGNLIVADCRNNAIRKIDKLFNVTTIAQGFNSPYGVAIDKMGNIFVSDYGNNGIKVIDRQGKVHAIADAEHSVFKEEPRYLNMPTGIGIDNYGNLVICDCYNHVIRKVNCVLVNMSQQWPNSNLRLPNEISDCTLELLCILNKKPPTSIPKELILLLIREVIVNWPI